MSCHCHLTPQFGSTVMRSMFFGATANTLNNLYHQTSSSCKAINWDDVGKSAALGGIGGTFGSIGGTLGKNLKDYSKATPIITNIRYHSSRWEGQIGDYGKTGAAIGAIIGGAIANGGLSW